MRGAIIDVVSRAQKLERPTGLTNQGDCKEDKHHRVSKKLRGMVVTKDPRVIIQVPHGKNTKERSMRLVYLFFEHPRWMHQISLTIIAVLYHLLAFFIPFICAVIATVKPNTWLMTFFRMMYGFEFDIQVVARLLAVVSNGILAMEYAIRLLVAPADLRYAGAKGRWKYATRPMNLFELVTLIAYTAHIIYGFSPDAGVFIVLMRVFHWDRSVHGVALLKKIFSRGINIVLSTLFIGIIVLNLNAVCTYTCETYFTLPDDPVREDDIIHFSHGMWYAYVSGMGIGYGDKIPKTGFCRIIATILSIASITCFYSLQTSIANMLTEHINNEMELRRDNRVRHTAAKLIQFWYRLHLAKDRNPVLDKYYELACHKLWKAKQLIIEERKFGSTRAKTRHFVKQLSKRARQSSQTLLTKGQFLSRRGSLPNDLGEIAKLVYAPLMAARSRRATTLSAHGSRASSRSRVHSATVEGGDSGDDQVPESREPKKDTIQSLPTVDERKPLVQHNDQVDIAYYDENSILEQKPYNRRDSIRKEFGPLIILFQFMLFGHFKRKFKNLEYRKTWEKKVEDDQVDLQNKLQEHIDELETKIKERELELKEDEDALEERLNSFAKNMDGMNERVDTLIILMNNTLQLMHGGDANPLARPDPEHRHRFTATATEANGSPVAVRMRTNTSYY